MGGAAAGKGVIAIGEEGAGVIEIGAATGAPAGGAAVGAGVVAVGLAEGLNAAPTKPMTKQRPAVKVAACRPPSVLLRTRNRHTTAAINNQNVRPVPNDLVAGMSTRTVASNAKRVTTPHQLSFFGGCSAPSTALGIGLVGSGSCGAAGGGTVMAVSCLWMDFGTVLPLPTSSGPGVGDVIGYHPLDRPDVTDPNRPASTRSWNPSCRCLE